VIMSSRIGDGITENQADGGADHANEDALGNEKVAHLGAASAHRHEYGNVFRLFHDHHNERDQDIQGGDENDESYSDESDKALQFEGVEQGLVLLLPVRGHETLAGGFFEFPRDRGGLVNVVHLEFEYGNQVSEAEQLLRIREANEGPTGVVIEEAGVENPYHVETIVFGDSPEGSQLALGTD